VADQDGRNWVVEELNYARSIGKPIRILMKTDPRFQGVATFEEMRELIPDAHRWVFEMILFHVRTGCRQASIEALLEQCPDMQRTVH